MTNVTKFMVSTMDRDDQIKSVRAIVRDIALKAELLKKMMEGEIISDPDLKEAVLETIFNVEGGIHDSSVLAIQTDAEILQEAKEEREYGNYVRQVRSDYYSRCM